MKTLIHIENENIFPPTCWAELLQRHMEVSENETVIDIGSGSEILAIHATRIGGKVYDSIFV